MAKSVTRNISKGLVVSGLCGFIEIEVNNDVGSEFADLYIDTSGVVCECEVNGLIDEIYSNLSQRLGVNLLSEDELMVWRSPCGVWDLISPILISVEIASLLVAEFAAINGVMTLELPQ
ncbi:hypothetical protein VCHA53O466_40198 [Vibrio chagasii]|nr:hypothetical protein VCHA53O466_40198 [Vibrio chagasii]